jgi:acetylornithine deacetylase
VPHPEPYFRDGIICGRGAVDMKNGLAGMAEMARLLYEADLTLPGTLLLTAYGRHEMPDGHGENLQILIEEGVHGDAAIVTEGPHEFLALVGKGQAVWDLTIQREGGAVHELHGRGQVPNPIWIGRELLRRIEARHRELSQEDYPYVGPGTYFVGQFHSGDFFNRIPTTCRLVGTRRWSPRSNFAEIKAEIEAMCGQLAADFGVTVRVDVGFSGEAYELDAAHPLVGACQRGYRHVTGRDLPLGGLDLLGDVSRLMLWGPVPSTYLGIDGTTAHSDCEICRVEDLVRATKTYLAAVLHYWAEGDGRGGMGREGAGREGKTIVGLPPL